MKRTPPWLTLLAFVSSLTGLAAWAGSAAPAVGPLPTPFPESRYQQISTRSPFTVATAAAPVAAATPGFAAQLYVDGVGRIGTNDYVAIKSRDPDQPNVIFLEVGKSTDDGLKVERVTWSNEMGKSTVDVSKGGERATLSFDEAQIAKNATAAADNEPPGVRLPMLPGGRPINLPNAQPQFNRFYPQQPGQPMAGPPGMNLPQGMINVQRRRFRGVIPAGQ